MSALLGITKSDKNFLWNKEATSIPEVEKMLAQLQQHSRYCTLSMTCKVIFGNKTCNRACLTFSIGPIYSAVQAKSKSSTDKCKAVLSRVGKKYSSMQHNGILQQQFFYQSLQTYSTGEMLSPDVALSLTYDSKSWHIFAFDLAVSQSV